MTLTRERPTLASCALAVKPLIPDRSYLNASGDLIHHDTHAAINTEQKGYYLTVNGERVLFPDDGLTDQRYTTDPQLAVLCWLQHVITITATQLMDT